MARHKPKCVVPEVLEGKYIHDRIQGDRAGRARHQHGQVPVGTDAVEKAGSGHPGSPVSLAPVAYTLYQHFIKHDPNDPNWEGRDRFILSGGHASLTQYVQLYFSGYGVTLDDLKHFRGGADTRTPGHPEYGLTPGIEMTTGPAGSGLCLRHRLRLRRTLPARPARPGDPEGRVPVLPQDLGHLR